MKYYVEYEFPAKPSNVIIKVRVQDEAEANVVLLDRQRYPNAKIIKEKTKKVIINQ